MGFWNLNENKRKKLKRMMSIRIDLYLLSVPSSELKSLSSLLHIVFFFKIKIKKKLK